MRPSSRSAHRRRWMIECQCPLTAFVVMTDLPVLKIFLSSPGDVAEERALAEFVFQRLADEVADVAHLRFLIWEHEPLFGHAGFQEQIARPSESDLVVTI